jgi:hypothetical protein
MKIHRPEKSAGKVDKVRVKMHRVSEDGIPSGYRSKSLMTMRNISCLDDRLVREFYVHMTTYSTGVSVSQIFKSGDSCSPG